MQHKKENTCHQLSKRKFPFSTTFSQFHCHTLHFCDSHDLKTDTNFPWTQPGTRCSYRKLTQKKKKLLLSSEITKRGRYFRLAWAPWWHVSFYRNLGVGGKGTPPHTHTHTRPLSLSPHFSYTHTRHKEQLGGYFLVSMVTSSSLTYRSCLPLVCFSLTKWLSRHAFLISNVWK